MSRLLQILCLASCVLSSAANAQPATQPVIERRLPPPLDKQIERPPRQFDEWLVDRKDFVHPNVRLMQFPSEIAQKPVSYLVILPPNYEDNPQWRFPVIYMLPSTRGDCRDFAPFASQIDELIHKGAIPPMIVVGVQGVFGSMYTDTTDGYRPIESVIIKELIPRVDSMFRTIPKREARGIEGFSMGGFGAAHLAFKYPDLFGVVSMLAPTIMPLKAFQDESPQISADVWHNDQQYFDDNDPFLLAAKNADQIRGNMKIRLYCGADDRYAACVADLHAQLDALKIAHEYKVAPGVKHQYGALLAAVATDVYPFWRRSFPRYEFVGGKPPTSRPTSRPATRP